MKAKVDVLSDPTGAAAAFEQQVALISGSEWCLFI